MALNTGQTKKKDTGHGGTGDGQKKDTGPRGQGGTGDEGCVRAFALAFPVLTTRANGGLPLPLFVGYAGMPFNTWTNQKRHGPLGARGHGGWGGAY